MRAMRRTSCAYGSGMGVLLGLGLGLGVRVRVRVGVWYRGGGRDRVGVANLRVRQRDGRVVQVLELLVQIGALRDGGLRTVIRVRGEG
jgi:hypothetical protein